MTAIRRRDFLTASLSAIAPVPLWRLHLPSPGRRAPSHLIDRWTWAMGQPVRLRLFTDDEARGYEAAQAAFAELRRSEAILSRFDPASELNALHATAGRGAHRASPDLNAALAAALAAHRATGGAFNAAIEPLMRVWGFRERRLAPPGARELAEARAALAASVVRIEGDRVSLPVAHTRLDLGGIGVGYAMDRAGAVLRARGVLSALLEVSGDVLAIGTPPGEVGWPVDIVSPGAASSPSAAGSAPAPPARVIAAISLRDRALATSGQDAQAIQLGPRHLGHVMDPAAGLPVTARRQASVVAASALAADVASTALLVSGRPDPSAIASWVL